jgi:hypothetical protein
MAVENLQINERASEPDRHDLLKRSVASAGVALLAISLLVGTEFAPGAAASSKFGRTCGGGQQLRRSGQSWRSLSD